MSSANRPREIRRAVDEMLRRMERWLNDPYGGLIVPRDVGLAIQGALAICDQGEIPTYCRDLAMVAVPRLAEELRGYNEREVGKIRLETGAPGPSFWAAAKAVARARAALMILANKSLEPVGVLLQQGVTPEQIAHHIYGHRGVGPFLQPNGLPDLGLIQREARKPGSVIPADWTPPWQEVATRRRQQVLSQQLKAFDRRERGRKYADPATIDDLLRDGAFIQQIERAKGVTRGEVLEAARRLGVTPEDGPGFGLNLRELPGFDLEEDDSGAASAADRQALRALVIELYSDSEGTRGAADITSELRKRGHDINTTAVAAMIGHWRRRRSKSNGTPAEPRSACVAAR